MAGNALVDCRLALFNRGAIVGSGRSYQLYLSRNGIQGTYVEWQAWVVARSIQPLWFGGVL